MKEEKKINIEPVTININDHEAMMKLRKKALIAHLLSAHSEVVKLQHNIEGLKASCKKQLEQLHWSLDHQSRRIYELREMVKDKQRLVAHQTSYRMGMDHAMRIAFGQELGDERSEAEWEIPPLVAEPELPGDVLNETDMVCNEEEPMR